MVDSPQECSEEHILSAISASTKPNESQIAKIGMMHNSKVGHFGLERKIKRLKDQNNVWQFHTTKWVRVTVESQWRNQGQGQGKRNNDRKRNKERKRNTKSNR